MKRDEEKVIRLRTIWPWALVLTVCLWPFLSFYVGVRAHKKKVIQKASEMSDVVTAVKKYRETHGTFPATLEKVVPGQANALQLEGWSYRHGPLPNDEATLELNGPFHSKLGHNFVSNPNSLTQPGWWYTEEGSPVNIPLPH